jgi:aspartate aminotransferase-like enzyme
MPGLLPHIDPDGLLEYSVVYTDRSLNHLSKRFATVMQELSAGLKEVYGAAAAVVVPGGGSYGMEAVARQFAGGQPVLIVRNGWFSYRWTQIFEMAGVASSSTVLKARRAQPGATEPFAPAPLDEIVSTIRETKPAVVFAPHVETSAGLMLPDGHLKAIADAVHAHEGLFVLDCVASGAMWVDMAQTGVDVLISAPQKGWSSTPCAGLVMLSPRALARLAETSSNSFALDLKKMGCHHGRARAGSVGLPRHLPHRRTGPAARRRARDARLRLRSGQGRAAGARPPGARLAGGARHCERGRAGLPGPPAWW